MKRNMKQFWIGFGVVALLGMLYWMPLAADAARSERKPPAIDAEQYTEMMASEAYDLEDLAEGAEIQRRIFNRMTPPGFSWLQPMFPSVVPFDAANYSESFLYDLLGEDKNSVAIYPLSLALDPKTRATLVYNAEGKLIASIPAEKSSDVWPEGADPARVTLLLDLLPSEDVEPYLYVKERIAKSLAAITSKFKSPKPSGVAMKSLGSSEFGICNFQKQTNGNMRLTITNGVSLAEIFSYTVLHSSSNVVSSNGTNTVWTPLSPPYNGLESAWECQTTNLILTNGVGVWEDSNILSNDRVRFYGVANRMDTDGDGLTDGTELFVYHSNNNMPDTDGDGLTDLEEVQLGTGLNASNIVQMVYFVDVLPEAPSRRSATESDVYVSWSNLQAKAMYTPRHKEGYGEFTSSNISASVPPKYYLTKGRRYQSECNGEVINPYEYEDCTDIMEYEMSQSNYCQEAFDPLGWPSTPTNHICSGYSDFSRTYFWDDCFYTIEVAWDYSYSQPTSSFPFSKTWWETRSLCTSNYNANVWDDSKDTCDFDSEGEWYGPDCLIGMGIPVSTTRSYNSRTNGHFLNCDSYSSPPYEVYEEVLTNEYTDIILWDYTDADLLMMMTNWDGLAWGYKLYRSDHNYPYSTNLLSSSYTYGLRDVNTDTNRIELQALRYRWEIPTDTGVVYKIFWQEDYWPDDDNWPWTSSTSEMKECNVLGTGSTAYSTNFDILPPGSNGYICLTPATRVDLEIYYPKVIDSAESFVPDADELTKGSVTFVNLDNDDNDDQFDYDGQYSDGIVIGGDNELIQIKLKIQSSTWSSGTARLIATTGATDIAVWASSNKAALSAYTLGTNMSLWGDFTYESNTYIKTLWVEGLSPHTVQQGTRLKLEFEIGTNTFEDEVALTVLGVDSVSWKGKNNSVTGSDILDSDTNWPSGLVPNAQRVFPGARAVSGSVETNARDMVDVEVSLSVAPPSEIKLYLKAFDVDDPTASTNVVDDETTAEDNRGTSPAQTGQFTGESGGVVELLFPENVKTTNAEFQVTMQPGDNFRVVVNGDTNFLATLANNDVAQDTGASEADKNANKQRIVCTNMTGSLSDQEIRSPGNYASDVLAVWRFLHVEVDSMAAPPTTGAEKNTVDGTLTAITGNGSVAQRAFLSINLNTGLTPQDPSANLSGTGNGRFENGWIKIGTGSGSPGETQTIDLLGNGDDYARKDGGIDIPALVSKAGQSDVSGKVIAWSGTVFTLSVSSGTLSTNYNGGTLNVAGIASTISSVSTNGGINAVTVTAAPTVPFVLHDDDVLAHPYQPNTSLMQASDSTNQNLFAIAYIRPIYDLGAGAKTNTFMRNVENAVAVAELAAGCDSTSYPRFWTAYVQGTFQGRIGEDTDPNSENTHLGRTPSLNSSGALVFMEAIRDCEIKGNISTGLLLQKVTTHETGHQFGLDHEINSIMQQGYPVPLIFAPRHINDMRNKLNP